MAFISTTEVAMEKRFSARERKWNFQDPMWKMFFRKNDVFRVKNPVEKWTKVNIWKNENFEIFKKLWKFCPRFRLFSFCFID